MDKNKIGLATFVGMTAALVASVRNITNVAAAGWTMFAYMIIAIVLFTLPVALISGEFASEFPGDGGPENWVTSSLGEKWGFVTSWLLWVQMFPGMVMVGSVLAPMIGETIGKPKLASNNIFTLFTILIIYWIVTLLNLKFDMAKIGGKIGIWLGLYIPIVFLFLGGIAAFIKLGINPHGMLGNFHAIQLLPNSATSSQIVPILFIFSGIEMSSVFMTRLHKPEKQYMKGVVFAMIFMAIFNIVNGFLLANVIDPKQGVALSNIAQGFGFMIKAIGLPSWIVNFFALLVFVGVVIQLSAWATGPSATIKSSARRGLYPVKFGFWKENKIGVTPSILFTQATVISLFALLYLVVPGANAAFLLFTSSTAIMYNVVYVIMAIGAAQARKNQPNLPRPFKVIGLYGITVLLIIIIIAATVVNFTSGSMIAAIIQIVITIVVMIIPLIIYSARKESWKTEVENLMTKESYKR